MPLYRQLYNIHVLTFLRKLAHYIWKLTDAMHRFESAIYPRQRWQRHGMDDDYSAILSVCIYARICLSIDVKGNGFSSRYEIGTGRWQASDGIDSVCDDPKVCRVR